MKRSGFFNYTVVFFWIASLSILTATPSLAGDEKAGDVSQGAIQWSQNCGRCHNLRGPTEYSDGQWRPVIAHMRVQAGLTEQQARNILAFIQATNSRATGTQMSMTASASDLTGEQVYRQTCLPCHGADGRGALPGVPDLRNRLGLADEVLLKHISEGFESPGSPMAMPAKGGNPNLTREDLVNVLSYMKEHFQP